MWIQVFGCQMNKLDGELVRAVLEEEGYLFTDREEDAGIILFMTCSVREHAENRVHSRVGALKRWKRKYPEGILGILGCMAQKDGKTLLKRHKHLNLIVGTRDFPHIGDLLARIRDGETGLAALNRSERPRVARKPSLRPQSFRAFLAVMRGCDSYCSYCIVPSVRGHEISRPFGEVMDEARRLVEDGVLEITLLGQTVNRYDDGEGHRLAHLVEAVGGLSGVKRLSFVTSHPAYVDEALIEAMAACPSITRCLHLPAQSGSDRILKRMKRRYRRGDYLTTVEALRARMPDLEMASDFIVGFPGETDGDFQDTESLMEEVGFLQSFVFKYSPRPGTHGARVYEDDVPRAVKEARNARLLEVQRAMSEAKNRARIGGEVEVLVEGPSRRDAGRYAGRTRDNRIAVFPPATRARGRARDLAGRGFDGPDLAR